MREKKCASKSVGNSTRFSSKKLKLASKKVEYFCSWVHLYWDDVKEDVVVEVEDWVDRYALKENI
jgi:hypothetical protein